MSIAGIDIGTTGCKCTAYSDEGKFINEAYREYRINKHNGEHELDAWDVWLNVKEVISEACKDIKDLKCIGVTSFGEAAVLVGANDKPLQKSMLYTDPRGSEECKSLIDHFGISRINQITGLNPHTMYTISKLMWIKKWQPEVYEVTKHIFLFEDFIVYMLCGIRQIDYSLASRTMAFDIEKLQWNDEILAFTGIDQNKLSQIVPIGSVAGNVKEELIDELCISSDTIIVSGCHDQVAAAIGTGILEEGTAVDGTGTVECITPIFKGIPNGKVLQEGSYAIVPYYKYGYYVTYAFSFTGGALLQWYRDKIANYEAEEAKTNGLNPYETFDKAVGNNPSGLLVLPHFSGAATPYMDSDSKGAIVGLTTETTSSDIYRALMEGVTYEMLINIEELEKAGIYIKELRATGGGASSKLWLQMKADILNIKIVSLGAAQSGTLGCIILAGVACGIYKNIEEAINIFVEIGEIFEPNPEKHKAYMKFYNNYKKLYEALKKII